MGNYKVRQTLYSDDTDTYMPLRDYIDMLNDIWENIPCKNRSIALVEIEATLEQAYGGDYAAIEHTIFYYRDETDVEYEKRMGKNQDHQRYLALKERFE